MTEPCLQTTKPMTRRQAQQVLERLINAAEPDMSKTLIADARTALTELVAERDEIETYWSGMIAKARNAISNRAQVLPGAPDVLDELIAQRNAAVDDATSLANTLYYRGLDDDPYDAITREVMAKYVTTEPFPLPR